MATTARTHTSIHHGVTARAVVTTTANWYAPAFVSFTNDKHDRRRPPS